ncbi:hypothetical protein [Nocardioides sp. TF02-7]|uniref:hypothetical protein n=1 Tax=Nocardioides sp. TF02-7 TaxID=2917724 RepID=UPI001F060738|nr:hypothetical protein [Nocardioides sp. TF02-7]UMG91847.1 hypothetical protein MF408_17640 [Nocardioides sp. TF02-7]
MRGVVPGAVGDHQEVVGAPLLTVETDRRRLPGEVPAGREAAQPAGHVVARDLEPRGTEQGDGLPEVAVRPVERVPRQLVPPVRARVVERADDSDGHDRQDHAQQ